MGILKIKSFISNPVARNSAIMFIGSMAANFGAYLYQLVVVRKMGPERYSEFAALLSLLFLLSVPAGVLQLVLTKYFSIYKAKNSPGEARTLLTKSLILIGVISVIGIIIYLPLIPFLQNLLHIRSFDSFVYLYLIVVGTFVITCLTGLLNGYQKFFSSSLNTTILTIFRLISGIICASISVSVTLLGNVISNLVSILFFVFSSKFILHTKEEKMQIRKKDVLEFTIPVFLSTLGMTAFFNMDVVLVKHFFDPTQAGIYASLTIFGKIIFFAASPIILVIFPMIVERKEKKQDYQSIFILSFAGVAAISILIVAGYAFSAPVITRLLFGDKFIIAAPYLGAYGTFMAFVTIMNYVMTVCLAVNKTKAGTIVLLGAIAESVAILLFHSSLNQVISSISVVSGALIAILLVYYRYDRISV